MNDWEKYLQMQRKRYITRICIHTVIVVAMISSLAIYCITEIDQIKTELQQIEVFITR